MTREQQLAYIRDKVIMACHPECATLEEAKMEELKFGCLVEFTDGNRRQICGADMLRHSTSEKNAGMEDHMEYLLCYFTSLGTFNKIYTDQDIKRIIGLPFTLPRILTALGKEYRYQNGEIGCMAMDSYGDDTQEFITWKLLNTDGSDCTLEQQEEQTIKDLYIPLGGPEQ